MVKDSSNAGGLVRPRYFCHCYRIEFIMQTKETLTQLQARAKTLGWDIIKEVGTLNNAPVYQLGRSGLPPRAKLGLPHLYAVNQSGIVELSVDAVLQFITTETFKSDGKRLQ